MTQRETQLRELITTIRAISERKTNSEEDSWYSPGDNGNFGDAHADGMSDGEILSARAWLKDLEALLATPETPSAGVSAAMVEAWANNCAVNEEQLRKEENPGGAEYHRGAKEAYQRVTDALMHRFPLAEKENRSYMNTLELESDPK